MRKPLLLISMFFLLVVFLSASICSAAVTNTWTGNTDTDWFTAGNWSENVVPDTGHHVVITNVATQVLLTNSTANLASFTITGETLTFTNWATTLNASNVTIQSGGTLTLPAAFTNNVMSNRVHVVCTSFALASGGIINADSKGYAGRSTNPGGPGCGPGAGQFTAGGGYGGKGGNWGSYVGGSPYGSTNTPNDPGSGGGGQSGYPGGAGGGLVRIEAANVTVNGTITANGESLVDGGGSGGGIFITCEGMFSGSTNGILQANGGNSSNSAGGGGGRIAVICSNMVRENVKVRFSASAGKGVPASTSAGMGTLYLPDTALLSETLANQFNNVRLIIPDFTFWGVTNLTVSNCVVSLGEGGFCLTVTNNLVIGSGGVLSLGGVALTNGLSEGAAGPATNPVVSVGGNVMLNGGGTLTLGGLGQGSKTVMDVGVNLILTNGGTLIVYSGVTNAVENCGALLTVTGAVSVSSASWIYPYSNPTNGGSVLFRVKALVISTNSGFNADAKGYAGRTTGANGPGYGPGAGQLAAGGGYGGKGGDYTSYLGGSPYGSTNAPIDPGSGGGGSGTYPGGAGGGAVRIEADGDMTVNGTITANGGAPGYSGGSGGGLFITCGGAFNGSTNGILRANGGDATYGAGGGGRIAVWYGVPQDRWEGIRDGSNMRRVSIITNASEYSEFAGTVSVTNGVSTSASNGVPGTIVFLTVTPPSGTVFMAR